MISIIHVDLKRYNSSMKFLVVKWFQKDWTNLAIRQVPGLYLLPSPNVFCWWPECFQQVLGYYAWGFYQVHKCPSNKSGETNSAWHFEGIGLCNFWDRFIISWDHFPRFPCTCSSTKLRRSRRFILQQPWILLLSSWWSDKCQRRNAQTQLLWMSANSWYFLLSALVRYVMCVSYCNSMDHFDGYPTSHGIAVLIMRNKTHLKPRTGHLAAVGSIIPSKNSPK